MATGPRGVGVIGLGTIGATHARVLHTLPEDFVVHCFSGGSAAIATDAGWPEAVQLPADDVPGHPGVDVVLICSPTGDHPERTLTALDAGCDVVVEKPFAVGGSDAAEIVEHAHARNRWVATIAQRRFEPISLQLKSMVAQGRLGSPRMASVRVHWWRDQDYYAAAPWRTSMAEGGGSLMNQGFHAVDLLRWFYGEVEQVTAQYGTLAHDIEAEDTTVATALFRSGALGTIGTSTATPPGDPATITLWFDHGTVELGDNQVLRWEFDGIAEPAPEQSGNHAGTSVSRIASGAADPRAIGLGGHRAQWEAIAEAIRRGAAPPVEVTDAAGTVRLLDGIYRAAETGRVVRPEEEC